MNPEKAFRSYALAGGNQAVVEDITRHYFGGYYHVRLQVVVEVGLSEEWFESSTAYEDALKHLGSPLVFSRMLEKMAVPEAEIDAVRQSLINDFETNLVPYLERPDFPSRFVIGEYSKLLRSSAPFRSYHYDK